MVNSILKKVFGSSNDRFLNSLNPEVQRINDIEANYKDLNNEDLRRHTFMFKQRIDNGESVDSLLPEAFAVVREAAIRSLGMRHYDVQLVGGIVLHKGMIAEMKTGEGKTLVSTLAGYLNALSGKGVHIVTVNDYLAKRDAEWMGQVYRFLGLDVGVIYSGMQEKDKKAAYLADVTYGQNNEFGFDYLRDNLKFSADHLVQRKHHYAIIDEVDSILIDEARTPLIISGPAEDSSNLYKKINKVIPRLKEGEDYEVDLKAKNPTLTEAGISHAEKLLNIENLYDPSEIEALHHVNQSLKAITVMQKDVDYVVNSGQVIIVDEFTGRLMPGRRWSDGLHQAVEAKEGVNIARENRTLASITFQNLFRLYGKLSGMTGTAITEATEFKSIYNLDVIIIPTNLPLQRKDLADAIFRTGTEKYNSVIQEIKDANENSQPVLVGTANIEQSELLSGMLAKQNISHNVLNAKHHEQEAQIVAQAGRPSSVTIATNMAGRGTDIVLGGNPEAMTLDNIDESEVEKIKDNCAKEKEIVLNAGGLYIIGTERHESRRIDNQLRGRAGRQGDPGKSRFYISLEDDLMKRFGSDRYQDMMKKMGWKEGMAIDSKLISRTIENAQSKVERFHFEGRKQVTEYDDVLNKQRQVVYNLRDKILNKNNIHKEVTTMIDDLLEEQVLDFCPEDKKIESWDIEALKEKYEYLFNSKIEIDEKSIRNQQEIFDHLRESAKNQYEELVSHQQEIFDKLSTDNESLADLEISLTEAGSVFDFKFETVEQETLLETLDHYWNSHLQQMDYLREGIGLRGYAQKNPLHEYQKEGFGLFSIFLEKTKEDVIRKLFYFDGNKLKSVISHIVAEHKRRKRVEEEMALAGKEAEAKKDKITSFQATTPEDAKAKIEAQKKARRKRR